MIIVFKYEYIGTPIFIEKRRMAVFAKNVAIIQEEVFQYLETYIKHVNGTKVLYPRVFNKMYQYSTLKYFHDELGL